MLDVRSPAMRNGVQQHLRPLTPVAFHATAAATLGTASALAGADRLALGKAGKVAGLGLTMLASRHAAQVIFPGTKDKPKHAMMSAAVTGAVTLATGKRWAGIGTGIVVGLLKECYDGSRFNPDGQRDFHLKGDLGADAIGIAMGALIR